MENSQSFKSLTILLVPNNGRENISSFQVLAEELQERGHKIVLAINISKSSKDAQTVTSQNSYEYVEDLDETPRTISETKDTLSDFDFEVFKCSPVEIAEKFSLKYLVKKFEETKEREAYYEKLIERVKPDIIIVESLICSPALTNSGIPWVWLIFGAPNLYLNDERLPPAWSGLQQRCFDQSWDIFRNKWNRIFHDLWTNLNQWCVSKGAPELPKNSFHPHSPYLNIYVYPKELDYKLTDDWPKNWVQLDCLQNKTNGEFSIPKQLIGKPGKLIYLSMGTYGCADLALMKRLIDILAKSQHKFIVSKGIFHDKYELPDNMWGLEELPQTDVLPLVDLVMTNGDNKTITDAFFYSKPLIVLPLFGDQLDNAQRVKDNGFGLCLEPYFSSLSTTFGCINTMLDDLLVYRRLSSISYKMQNSDARKRASTLIEKILDI